MLIFILGTCIQTGNTQYLRSQNVYPGAGAWAHNVYPGAGCKFQGPSLVEDWNQPIRHWRLGTHFGSFCTECYPSDK